MALNYSRLHWQETIYNITSANVFPNISPNAVQSSTDSFWNLTKAESVHDKSYNKLIRLICLYTIIFCGTVGGCTLMLWMCFSRQRKSRVNLLILNLTAADMLVLFLACLPQLVWEHVDREWTAGQTFCKIVKFSQSFSMMASTYMLLVIAADKHQAIRKPLTKPWAVWKMASVGWAIAAVASFPMFFVFHENVVNNSTRCENVFRNRPTSHRQVFLTYVAVIVFLVPLVFLVVCYTRIFLKIARKASENSAASQWGGARSRRVRLQRTPSAALPKAKVKALKMALVIAIVYIICTLPYFCAEMILSYGSHVILSPDAYAILGGLAAANSAANPYVLLYFSVKSNCLSHLNFDRVSFKYISRRKGGVATASGSESTSKSGCCNTAIKVTRKAATSDKEACTLPEAVQ